jgi:hypothetical protein
LFFEALLAIIPCYQQGKGNGCMLIWKDREDQWVSMSIKTCLNHWAKHYCTDIREVKKRTRESLPITNILPLYIHAGCTLMALKMRIPIFKDDGAYGYFRVEAIKEFKEVNGQVMVCFTNGRKEDILTSKKTAEKHKAIAEVVHIFFPCA